MNECRPGAAVVKLPEEMCGSWFPARYQERDFRPARGSDDYNRLQSYWIFAYAEWFATRRLEQGADSDLWNQYYKGLLLNAMEIPSLRYVLIDMSQSYGTRRPGLGMFYGALKAIALEAHEPLPDPSGAAVPPIAADAALSSDRP